VAGRVLEAACKQHKEASGPGMFGDLEEGHSMHKIYTAAADVSSK
jgi:hypothetical protein